MSGETSTSCSKRSESAGWPNMGPVRLLAAAAFNGKKVFRESNCIGVGLEDGLCVQILGELFCSVLWCKRFHSAEPF